jgi:ubiquitin carboxyl-terminal hydrolase 14
MIPVKVKWNNQTFDNLEIDPSKSVVDFKNELKTLTNVPVERQKLMAKGGWAGILKDDADWKNCKLSPGLTVLLMGSAEVAPEPMDVASQSTKAENPEKGGTEDNLKSDGPEEGPAHLNYPTGMLNTGNTCYLNSVLEALRFLPEFNDTLNLPGLSSNSRLLMILNQVYQIMKSTKTAVAPFPFITELRTRFPQFSEMRNGHYAQQDADELFSCIATELQNTVSHSNAVVPSHANCFTFDVDVILSCAETNEEEPVHMIETMNKLSCNIQGGTDKQKVDNLYEGLKLGFECTIDKFSAKLNRDAQWHKKQKLINLPGCLCIHFVRFYWKAFPTPNSNGQTGVKCKIMRQINYPEVCSRILLFCFLSNRFFLDLGYV